MAVSLTPVGSAAASPQLAAAQREARAAEHTARTLRSQADAAQRSADQEQEKADRLDVRASDASARSGHAQQAVVARQRDARPDVQLNTLPDLPAPLPRFGETGGAKGQLLSVRA